MRQKLLLFKSVLVFQIDNKAGKDQDNGRTNADGGDKNPHETFILPWNDVFEVSVAGGKSFAHLNNPVRLTDSALVQLVQALVETI